MRRYLVVTDQTLGGPHSIAPAGEARAEAGNVPRPRAGLAARRSPVDRVGGARERAQATRDGTLERFKVLGAEGDGRGG